MRRAGKLRNRWRAITVVPAGAPSVPDDIISPSAISMRKPSSPPRVRVRISTRETAATLGSASPRKPSVPMDSRSAAALSLLVAKRWKASSTCSGGIPEPLSVTRMYSTPPPRNSTDTRVAPASRAFSTNSFTAEDGRSMTSPAAIRVDTAGARRRMGIRRGPPYSGRLARAAR